MMTTSTPESWTVRRLLPVARARIRWWAALIAVAGASALIATRFGALEGRLVYNFDSPVDFLLPSAFHDALIQGRLPLWSDKLGLGFPLYAEGKIAAFYPPHWLLYQLPPLAAVQAVLLVHLTWLGIGTGTLAGSISRLGRPSLFAAAAMPLVGGVITKLEWTNMVEAFAWLPWILLPLVRHDRPSRGDVALSGMAFGIQALLGHPNIWLLSGLTVVLITLAREPNFGGARRAIAVVLIGAGVGAVQLVPTVVLIPLSVRANGLDERDFFAYPGTIFDGLGFAFASAFTPLSATSDLNRTWYPSGAWGLLEAGAYVGLPVIALAAAGFRSRRLWPLLLPLGVFVIGPLLWMLHPDWLSSVPVLNALRRPTRAYAFADFVLVVAAAIGFERTRDQRQRTRGPGLVVASLVAGYVAVAALASFAPGRFSALLGSMWPYGSASLSGESPPAILTAPVPVLFEILLGVAMLGVLRAGARSTSAAIATCAMAVVPLALLMPGTNQAWGFSAFDRADGPFIAALRAASPTRVLTVDRPAWYDGTPNQIALAGIDDLEMHGSLGLSASATLLAEVRSDRGRELARALGVDTVVTFGESCPGTAVASVPDDHALICHLDGARRPPYWLPSKDVTLSGGSPDLLILPRQASVSASVAMHDAVPATVVSRGGQLTVEIAAPSDGWVFIDRSWWPFLRVTLDGQLVDVRELWSGQLVHVNAGKHTISERLVPWDALAGLAIGLGSLGAILIWVYVGPRKDQKTPERE